MAAGDAEYRVVYRAVADFSNLAAEVAKAKALVKSLNDETSKAGGGTTAADDKTVASKKKTAKAINEVTDAQKKQKTAAEETAAAEVKSAKVREDAEKALAATKERIRLEQQAAEEKDRKARETAEEKERKARVAAEEKERKARETAAEKAAEKEQKARETAAEKERKARETAAEKEQKARAAAEEKAQKAQTAAEEKDRKARETAAEKEQKAQTAAAEKEQKARAAAEEKERKARTAAAEKEQKARIAAVEKEQKARAAAEEKEQKARVTAEEKAQKAQVAAEEKEQKARKAAADKATKEAERTFKAFQRQAVAAQSPRTGFMGQIQRQAAQHRVDVRDEAMRRARGREGIPEPAEARRLEREAAQEATRVQRLAAQEARRVTQVTRAAERATAARRRKRGVIRTTAVAGGDLVRGTTRAAISGGRAANVFQSVYRGFGKGLERDVGRLERLRVATREARKEMQAAGGGGGNFGRFIGDFTSAGDKALPKLWSFLKGLMSWRGLIVLAIAALGPLVSMMGALGAAAVGVANTLGALAGSAAALPGLFLAAATGIGALVIAFQPLMNVFQAYQARQKAVAAGAKQRADAEREAAEKVRQALHSQQQASLAYGQSLYTEWRAQVSLNEARRAATRELEDMHTALSRMNLNEQEAILAVKEAEANYRKTLADANSTQLDREGALLRVKDAENDLADVRTKNKRLVEDGVLADKRGVEGSLQVVDARNAAQNATQGVADAAYQFAEATRNLTQAQKEQAAGGAAALKATNEYEDALGKLSPSARKVWDAFVGMSGAWKTLQSLVSENIFGPLSKNLSLFSGVFEGDGGLNDLLGRASEKIGDFILKGATLMTSGPWKKDFGDLAKSNATIIENLGTAALSVATAFKDIAVAAAPFTEWVSDAIKNVADNFAKWAESGKNSGSIRTFLGIVETRMQQLGDIIGNVFSLFKSLFFASNDFTGGFLESIKKVTAEWANWGTEQEKTGSSFRNWLDRVTPLLSDVWTFLKEVGVAFGQIAADPKNIEEAQSILKTLAEDVLPALVGIFHDLSESHAISRVGDALGKFFTAVKKFLDNGGLLPITTFLEALLWGLEKIFWLGSTEAGAKMISGFTAALAGLAAMAVIAKFAGLFKLWDLFKWFAKNKGSFKELFTGGGEGGSRGKAFGDIFTGKGSQGSDIRGGSAVGIYTRQLDTIIGLLRRGAGPGGGPGGGPDIDVDPDGPDGGRPRSNKASKGKRSWKRLGRRLPAEEAAEAAEDAADDPGWFGSRKRRGLPPREPGAWKKNLPWRRSRGADIANAVDDVTPATDPRKDWFTQDKAVSPAEELPAEELPVGARRKNPRTKSRARKWGGRAAKGAGAALIAGIALDSFGFFDDAAYASDGSTPVDETDSGPGVMDIAMGAGGLGLSMLDFLPMGGGRDADVDEPTPRSRGEARAARGSTAARAEARAASRAGGRLGGLARGARGAGGLLRGGRLLRGAGSLLKGGGGIGLIGAAVGMAADSGMFGGRGSTGKQAGQAGGAILSGAATGAMIGSIIPGVGTAIGGVVGGIAGGAYSLYKDKGMRDKVGGFLENNKWAQMLGGPLTGTLGKLLEGKIDLGKIFSDIGGKLKKALSGDFLFKSDWWKEHGKNVEKLVDRFKTGFRAIKGIFGAIFGGEDNPFSKLLPIKILHKYWEGITVIFKNGADGITSIFKSWGAVLGGILSIVWDGIVTGAKIGWELLKGVFGTFIDLLTGDWGGAWNTIKETVSNIWGEISGFLSRSWDTFVEVAGKVWDNIVGAISRSFGRVVDFVAGIWSSVYKTAVDAWNSMTGWIGQKVVELFSWILDELKKHAGPAGTLLAKGIEALVGKQSGGLIEGNQDGQVDNKLIRATPGEWMIRKSRVDQPDGKRLLGDINEGRIDAASVYAALDIATRKANVPINAPARVAAASSTVINNNSSNTRNAGLTLGDVTINNPIRERSDRSLRRTLQSVATLERPGRG